MVGDETCPQYLRKRRIWAVKELRLMSIYAFVVALWFMAVALFLVGASIRSWFRSPRDRPAVDAARQ
jgi:hypothetical protein